MFSWYFPQLLEQYQLCKSELDKIEIHIDDLEKNKTVYKINRIIGNFLTSFHLMS